MLKAWLEEGLLWHAVTDASVLSQFTERSRASGTKLRVPEATKFAAMNAFLQKRRVLRHVVMRARPAVNPGLPDLFLYRLDRHGRVHGGRLVEVKKWDRRKKVREPLSSGQKDELQFLRGLGLMATVVYLLES